LLILLYFVQNHGRGSLAADNFEEIIISELPPTATKVVLFFAFYKKIKK